MWHLMETIRSGSIDAQVCLLQRQLIDRGWLDADVGEDGRYVQADGKFGPGTRSAVMAFQSDAGLVDDGIVGPATWQMFADVTPPTDPALPPEPQPPVVHDSMKMMVLPRTRQVTDTHMRKVVDTYQRVIDKYYSKDWGHIELRIGSEDSLDDTEVLHTVIDREQRESILGYHTIRVVNTPRGQIIVPVAITYVDQPGGLWEETFGHEVFETEGNPPTLGLNGEFGESDRLRMQENCDPTSGAPVIVDGIAVAVWVKRRYLQGLNGHDEHLYDAAHWFGELPRVTGPKRRVPGSGFQIYLNMATRQFENEFGDYPAGEPWANRAPLAMRTQPMTSTQLPEHAHRRCLRYYQTIQALQDGAIA